MQVVPVQAVPSQTLTITLGGQSVALNIYQMNDYGLFMDVILNGTLLVSGVICQQANRILRDAYFGFIGDFAWFDTENTTEPEPPYYTGIGSRWILAYLTPADLGGVA